MKIVRMLHPFCIPVFGYIAGGDEIGMPDNIAEAMVASGYGVYLKVESPPEVAELPSEAAPVAAIEPPIEVPVELHKSKRTKSPVIEDKMASMSADTLGELDNWSISPVAEDAPAEEN